MSALGDDNIQDLLPAAALDWPKLGADEGAVCPKVGATPDEAPMLLWPPKPPVEPNAGADCPNAGAGAVLLPEPKLNAGALLAAVLLLPPKLNVDLLVGAAAGTCEGLLVPKAKLGAVLAAEAPKPNAGELLGADVVLLCGKPKDGVLLAGWAAPLG